MRHRLEGRIAEIADCELIRGHRRPVDDHLQHRWIAEVAVLDEITAQRSRGPRLELVVEGATAQGRRHGPLDGPVGDVDLRAWTVEEGRVDAQRVEREAARRDLPGPSVEHRIVLQSPEEQADVADVVAAPAVVDVANLGRMGGGLEGHAGELGLGVIAQIGGCQVTQPDVVEFLGRRQERKELDGFGRPTTDVARQALEDRRGPLAPAVGQRVRDDGALREGRAAGRWDQPLHPEQVADVGHHPLIAGLDEPVLVQLVDVILQCLELLLKDREHRLENIALVRIGDAVDRREEVVEPVRDHRDHTSDPVAVMEIPTRFTRRSCPGTIVSATT